MQNPQTVLGTVKNLTFRNEETGYFIARVNVPGKDVEQTVLGSAPVIHPGQHIEAKGAWVQSKWGPQFKASEVNITAPTSLVGIEKYLASGAIDGIGKVYAKKLVAAFGAKVFDVIEQTPELLNDVPGVGAKRAQSIVAAYKEDKVVRELRVFLLQHGLPPSSFNRIYKMFGDDAQEKIKKNPYLLFEVWGIGFSKADGFAQSTGIKKDSEHRITAGIQHVVREAQSMGSCGVPRDVLLEKASMLLDLEFKQIEPFLEKAVKERTLMRDIAGGYDCYFPAKLYLAEKKIAEILLHRSRAKDFTPIENPEQAMLHAELDIGITLEETQKKAVLAALANPVCVITGGPGTGKTTISKTIIQILEDAGNDVIIAAPTGKASRRASEATGREAKTIHRMLEIAKNGGFKRNEDNPLETDVVLLDELSMVDVPLFLSALKALPDGCRLLLVGDVDQIPSVGPGKILKDIIDSGMIPVVKLTEVFRQAKTSKIVMNAHTVNRGAAPDSGWAQGSDFGFLDQYEDKEKDKTDEALVKLVKDLWKMGYDPIVDVQVLTPMRKGPLGMIALNEKLRAVLNPDPEDKVQFGQGFYYTGDKVMQLRNNYEKEVFNGDVGRVTKINHKDRTIVVTYDAREVTYRLNELDEITLAYAMTIHKSQGSEFPVVVMPLDTSHFMMLKRNLVYTGITRAKKLMLIIGSKKAAWMAVKNTQVDDRYTRLREWLCAKPAVEVADI